MDRAHFLLSYLFSLSLLPPLFSFFLFTMPKFLRGSLWRLQWTTWGRGAEPPPLPTLAPPLEVLDYYTYHWLRIAQVVEGAGTSLRWCEPWLQTFQSMVREKRHGAGWCHQVRHLHLFIGNAITSQSQRWMLGTSWMVH